nr:immunoglobulin heavy chain junction region [Macaca mulatta]
CTRLEQTGFDVW